MTGVRGDFVKLNRLTKEMARLGVTARKDVLKVFAVSMMTFTDKCFQTSTSPYGEAWPPLKNPPPKRQGGMPLLDTRRLANSVSAGTRPTGTGISISSNVAYAGIHNYGGTIAHAERSELRRYTSGKKRRRLKLNSKNVRSVRTVASFGAHSVGIPKRQYLPDAARGLPPKYVATLEATASSVLEMLKKATR